MKRYCLAILVVLAVAGTAPQAKAGPREDVMSAASQCFQLQDNRAWLACYLAAAKPMEAALGTAPPARAAAAPPPAYAPAPAYAPPPRPARAAAANSRTSSSPGDVLGGDSVTSRLAKYSFSRDGRFIVTLENGQVWEQVNAGPDYATFTAPPGRYVATVSRAFFGDYNLSIDGMSGLFKVRRVS